MHIYVSQFFSKSLEIVRKYGHFEISWQSKAEKMLGCPYWIFSLLLYNNKYLLLFSRSYYWVTGL